MAIAKCTHRKASGAVCTGRVDTDDTWYITTTYYSSAFPALCWVCCFYSDDEVSQSCDFSTH